MQKRKPMALVMRVGLAATLAGSLVPATAWGALAPAEPTEPLVPALSAPSLTASLTSSADVVRTAAARASVDESIAWYVGNESAASFDLYSATELRGLSDLVAGRARGADGALIAPQTFEGVTFNLLVSSEDTGGICNLGGQEWAPIGTEDHPFDGAFDGREATVIGLSITGAQGTKNQGLFGYAGPHSSIKNLTLLSDSAYPSRVALTAATSAVENVGTVVGFSAGTVENCTSSVTVTVNSTLQATKAVPWVARNVGGVAGQVLGDMTNCHYTAEGALKVTVASDVVDATADDLRVSDSFGGVVGRFGEAWPADKQLATLSGCTNRAEVRVVNTGGGSKDNFGTATYARSSFVGGVVGYSNGNLTQCENGTYNGLKWESDGNVWTLSEEQWEQRFTDGHGAEKVGGVVGSVRGASDGSVGLATSDPNYRYNDGHPDYPVRVENCHNVGMVVGCVSVGGIAGDIGSFTTLTQCRNGLPTVTSLDENGWSGAGKGEKIAGHVVCNRWNKPISGGIVGRAWASEVSFCANYADVENTKTGYYTAGICGALWKSDDYPDVQGELFSCFNTGAVYTANENAATEFREAAILGNNEGYVHDCIYLEGCVPFHKDAAIGASTWGNYANLTSMTQAQIGTSASAAALNAPLTAAGADGSWDCYWFMNTTVDELGNRNSYPSLNVWNETVDKVTLSASSVAVVEQVKPAAYVGIGDDDAPGPVPSLTVKLQDGTVLHQGADFTVQAQVGAWERTDNQENKTPYTATLVGMGMYEGTVVVENCYGIGEASLTDAKVSVGSQRYNFGRVVFPESLAVSIGGLPVEEGQYDFVIYDKETTADQVRKGGASEKMCLRVFDSCGYVEWADGTRESLSELLKADAAGVMGRLNTETGWSLYDRGGFVNADGKEFVDPVKISDSEGNAYLPGYPNNPQANRSCVSLKSGTPAGYVVKVSPAEGSDLAADSFAIGYYVIDVLNLRNDCTLNEVRLAGQNLRWDNDRSELYACDAEGNPILRGATDDPARYYALPTVPFTGKSIEGATVDLTCGDYALQLTKDYKLVYGDPDPAQVEHDPGLSDAATDAASLPNRNVTGGGVRAAVTILPASTSNMSNYFIGYFGIAPASLNDCVITGGNTTQTYTGSALRPVKVTLNGVALMEGVDYQVTYSNNVNNGTASFTVTPLANLNASGTTPVTGTFTITGQPTAPSVTPGAPSGSGSAAGGAGAGSASASGSAAAPAAKPAPKAPTVRFAKAAVSKAYGAKAFGLGATVTKGLRASYTSSNKKVAAVSSSGKVTVKGVGQAVITLRTAATASYRAGSATCTVKVSPAKAAPKLKAAKRGFKVTAKKVAKASGYQVMYSTSKSKLAKGKGTVVKAKGAGALSKTVSKLKARTTYYVKVRAYAPGTTAKGKKTTVYGAWSSVKKVKTK